MEFEQLQANTPHYTDLSRKANSNHEFKLNDKVWCGGSLFKICSFSPQDKNLVGLANIGIDLELSEYVHVNELELVEG